MPVRALDIDDPRWDAFVAAQPGALPYHHPRWAALFARSYGFRVFAVVTEDAGGTITAGAPVAEVGVPLRPRKWASLPFTDFCPPLARDGAARAGLDAAWSGALADAGIGRLELRAEVASPAFRRVTQGFRHELALTADPADVHAGFHRSQVQRAIRKGEKSGLMLRRGSSREDLVGVFYALHLRTRRRQGTPVQPRRFFEALWADFLSRDLGFVSLAYDGPRPIAGAVFLTFNRKVVYKYGASEPEGWSHRPNHLIFWDAIRWACEEGYTSLDFGRTEADNPGLRAFKLGWGPAEHPLMYSEIGGAGSHDYASPSRARATATRVIQRSPPWVCRATGELLYKFSA